jgi:uncharacterized membrane protein
VTHPGSASSWRALATLLAVAGTSHLLAPKIYRPLIPRRLGRPEPWVLWSGVAELACAAGLLHPRTRPTAARVSAAVFVAVFPGNVQMAVMAIRTPHPAGYRAVTLARLPLQVPLVRWALRVARDTR